MRITKTATRCSKGFHVATTSKKPYATMSDELPTGEKDKTNLDVT